MSSDVVPVLLNVEEGKENVGAYARVSSQARFQQWRYTLSIDDPSRMSLDALQIGRIIRPKPGQPLQIRSKLCQPCARLDGHWLMRQKRRTFEGLITAGNT